MRTTVTLDTDVHQLLVRAAQQSGEPVKQVLNDALRLGLKGRSAARATPFKQRTFRLGKPLVDLTKANALAADLEDLEYLAKAKRGR